MIERLLVGVMLLVGAVLLLLGYGTAGIILLAVGLITAVLLYRIENKRYKTIDRYIIVDAKLTDDRED
jgi:hypothetical protein